MYLLSLEGAFLFVCLFLILRLIDRLANQRLLWSVEGASEALNWEPGEGFLFFFCTPYCASLITQRWRRKKEMAE